MQTARQLIEVDAGPDTPVDLTTIAYIINYNFSYDYQLTADHVWAIRQNPEVLLTPTAKRKVNPLIVDLMLNSASAGAYEWVSQIKDVITADVLLHQYTVYTTPGAFGIEQKRRVIDTASKFGFGPHLDQKAYRTAMAAVLRKEESTAAEPHELKDPEADSRMYRALKILRHVDDQYTLAPWCISLLKADPGLLTTSPFNDIWPLLIFLLNGLPPAQMRKIDGLVTPEMLLGPSNVNERKGLAVCPANQTVLDVIISRGYDDKVNPNTYRKAMAMKLRKEESLDLNKRYAGPPFYTDGDAAAWVMHSLLTHRRLTPAALELIRDNPRLLSVRPDGFFWTLLGELIWANHVNDGAKDWLRSISDLITPEMLAKPSGKLNRASALDAVNRTGAQAFIDPAVYRKAMALQLGVEESLPDPAPAGGLSRIRRDEKIGELYTHIRSNRPFNAEQIGWMRKDPAILTDRNARPRSLIELAALYADTKDASMTPVLCHNTALKQMSDLNLITPEMLAQSSGFHKDTSILRRVEAYGAVQHLDPGVYRKAMALELKQP